MMHKVEVVYYVEVEAPADADLKKIAGAARALIEQTSYGETCSTVRILTKQSDEEIK